MNQFTENNRQSDSALGDAATASANLIAPMAAAGSRGHLTPTRISP
jgi:hypothetical protein